MAPRTYRMSGCKEAPVFHPTLAEFADPLRYIASIRAVAEPCGLCRIVPPDGFVVPFNQDRASFTFKTRVQTVTELQLRVAKGKHRSWRVEYVEFMQTHEHQTVTRWPVFGGRKLDLRVLYESVVASQGGFDLACRGKLWRTIASGLEGTDASASDASALKQLYQKWLLPFETHKKRTATLSPASKAKEAASTKKEKEEERRREKASAAAAVERASAMEQPSEKEEDLLEALFELGNVAEPPPKRLKLEMGLEEVAQQLEAFGCQNCGGSAHEDSMILCDGCDFGYHTYCLAPPLTSIPAGDWFCPDCIALATHTDDLGFNTGKAFTVDEFETSCAKFDERFFAKNGDSSASGNQKPPLPEIEEHFWRMVEEGTGGSSHGDTVDVHYGADVDTSTHGSAFPRAWDVDHGANRGDHANAAALCAWNLNNIPHHPSVFKSLTRKDSNARSSTRASTGGMDASDDDDDDDDDETDRVSLDGAPPSDGEHRSLLRRVRDHIPGVLVPWLYFGSTFSSFCWHFEDHALYSMNYNHVGAAKTWYGVPGTSAEAFEESFKKAMPDLFAAAPDLLFQLVTMLSPSWLTKDNVPVYRTDQHAGEFVVTFPRAYHAGFNTGFNVAEAVNFAPPDWLRFARFGVERYREFHKPSVLCHDELLCVAAQDSLIGPETAKWLLGDLKQTLAEERAGREKLFADGVTRSRRYVPKKLVAKAALAQTKLERKQETMQGTPPGGRKSKYPPNAEKMEAGEDGGKASAIVRDDKSVCDKNANGAYDRECTICRYILHLSGVACTCNPDRPACLRHSAELCDCPNSNKVLFYRKSIAQLERLVRSVERQCGGKKQKGASLDAKSATSAKARSRKSQLWVKDAKAALAQKTPPLAPEALETILIASEEFTWAGEDMDDARGVAHKVSLAIAFQRELGVLKKRIDATLNNVDGGETAAVAWQEQTVDDADIVVAAAAGAPVRVRRNGKYVDRETDAEAAARRVAEETASAAAEAKVIRDVAAAAIDLQTPVKMEDSDVKDVKEAPAVAPPRRMTLRRLRELLDAAPFPLPDSDSEAFSSALAAGEDLELRVASALAERPFPNPKRCISLAAETTRGPLEVTSAKRLRETVAAAHAWSERLRKTLPGKRHRAARTELPRASDLHKLRADAKALPVQPNDLASLDAALLETETWIEKSRALLDAVDADRFTIDSAELLLQEGQLLPVACDEVDAVATAVAEAKTWDESARVADEADAALAVLKRLLAQVVRIPKETNTASTLEETPALTVRTPDETETFLLVLPDETDALRERIRVREWADPARRIAAGKPAAASLGEIRAAVAEGAAILEGTGAFVSGPDPDETERAKLEQQAYREKEKADAQKEKKRGGRKKAGNSGSVVAEPLVVQPPPVTLPAVSDDRVTDFERALLERLRLCVSLGEVWETKAGKILRDAKKEGRKPTLVPLEDVEKLVKESLAIAATLAGASELTELTSEARKWSEKAQSCLKGKQLTRRGASSVEPKPTLAHAERLIRDAGKFVFSMKELGLLQDRVVKAKEWGVRAEEVLDRWREEGAEVTFNEIMATHDGFGLELPAATDVRAFIGALEWEREARDALALGGDGHEYNDDDKPDVEVLQDLRDRAGELDTDIAEEMEQTLLEQVKKRLAMCDEWLARVEKTLKFAPTATTTDGETKENTTTSTTSLREKPKPVSVDRGPAADAKVDAEKRPTPETVRLLVLEGKKLPAVSKKVAELETQLEEHLGWVLEARVLLGPPAPEPTDLERERDAAAAMEEAVVREEELAEEKRARRAKDKDKRRWGQGKTGRHGVKSAGGGGASETPGDADSAVDKARVARRAKTILAAVAVTLETRKEQEEQEEQEEQKEQETGHENNRSKRKKRPEMNDVLALLRKGESLPFKSEEGAAVSATAAAAVAWSDKLRKMLVRPRSSAGAHAVAVEDTHTALKMITQSIRNAIHDLEGTGEPPEHEEGQFCLCRLPGGKEMIGCDICGDWYHLRCVSVTAAYARNAKHYTCPVCRAAQVDGDVFEINKPDVTHKHIHRTRRPALASLGEALLEAVKFRGKPMEEDLLVEVFTLHQLWRAAVVSAKQRRAGVAKIETVAAQARAAWEAAEAIASVPRSERTKRADGVRDRAAAVQRAQVLAGATAMAAALLGAGGGGTAAAAMEATQRVATLPPEQQLDALGQQVAAAAAIKQQQLMQLKGAVAAAAAAGLAGGDNSQESVAAAAESASPFEQLLIAQLQELGTFVHQLANSQQHIQAQLSSAAPNDAAAQQYQVVIQVMMLQQHYVALSKQQDVQLETLGSGLLEQQRVVAAAAAAAMEQDEEEVEVPIEQVVPREAVATDTNAEHARDAKKANVTTDAETDAPTTDAPGDAPGEVNANAPTDPAPVDPTPETTPAEPAPAPAFSSVRRKKAPEVPSQAELELTAKATFLKSIADTQNAILLKHTTPSPKRQMLAGLKGALAMEIEHDPTEPELPILLRETCGAGWVRRAEGALASVPGKILEAFSCEIFENENEKAGDDNVSNVSSEENAISSSANYPSYPTLSTLTKLRETGVACGMIVPGSSPETAPNLQGLQIFNLERLGQLWLDRAADAVDKTRDVPVDEVKALLTEGKKLPINLKEELEELGERCEVYCLCATSYDAQRPMISCDCCEGWFHYECCDMAPPALDEPEDESVRFKCPPCCVAGNIKYEPFRPPPDREAMAVAAKKKADDLAKRLAERDASSVENENENGTEGGDAGEENEGRSDKEDPPVEPEKEAEEEPEKEDPMDTEEGARPEETPKEEPEVVEEEPAPKEEEPKVEKSGRGARRSRR